MSHYCRRSAWGRGAAVFLCAAAVWTCKTALPPAPVVPTPPPPVPVERKVAWLLRLEHQRLLRDAPLADAPAASLTPGALAPARLPDLAALVADLDSAVRRRAALAIGRVGLPEGVPALSAALADPDDTVRESAAFALGLIGAVAGVAPLQTALADPSPMVRGRAAEALGLIGSTAKTAAPAVATAFAGCASLIAAVPADEEAPQAAPIEACRLALFSLVRLGDYDALARVALDAQGLPVSRWWPLAFALQRIGDRRAAPALLSLATADGVSTPAFALRGLGALRDPRVLPIAEAVAARPTADLRLRIAAVRAIAQAGSASAAPPLLKRLADASTPPNLGLEIVTALGALGNPGSMDALLDRFNDPWAAMRIAALGAAIKVDADAALVLASNFGVDPEWTVRAALAGVLGTLDAERVRDALIVLAADQDQRVRGPALTALARVGAPDLEARIVEALDAADFSLRAVAAGLAAEKKISNLVPRLAGAYERAQSDATDTARAAVVDALATLGDPSARVVLRQALGDRAWAIRVRAAERLRALGEAVDPARPAPLRHDPALFESPALLRPAYSPHAFIETRHGTIELELNVVEAPLTTRSFIELARAGFYNGLKVHRLVPNFVMQTGDPRGDGEGGPGFTILDELSPLPYLRGTVGMALDGRDSGGSQFFITHFAQPHLDGRYTVFGRVVNGLAVLDRVMQGDVIDRIRIWDGTTLK